MSKKYYRTRIAGLSVHTSEPKDGDVAPGRTRFKPFLEKFQGDEVKVGYLATDDETAQKKLDQDINVEKIEKSDYEKATDTNNGARPTVF